MDIEAIVDFKADFENENVSDKQAFYGLLKDLIRPKLKGLEHGTEEHNKLNVLYQEVCRKYNKAQGVI